MVAALVPLRAVHADGEAGLVIQQGSDVETFCIAFEGDSISGEALLRAAGRSFGQFGGSARVLCSLDGVGCDDASSFESCFCQCEAGSGSCTYWAFFTQRYGAAWAYSTVGFNLSRARDGDLHGWKWGAGGPQSAPAPLPMTFEDVCGHPPSGGAPPATATTPPPPTAATGETPAPSATASAGAPPGSPSTPGPSASPTATGAASPVASPQPSRPSAAGPTLAPSVTLTIGRPPSPSPSLSPAVSSPVTPDGGGSSTARVVSFASVAGVLLVALAAAIVWRRRRDH